LWHYKMCPFGTSWINKDGAIREGLTP
jgi:hypothetical protein